MKDYVVKLDQSYAIAFKKYDKEIKSALQTAEEIYSTYKSKLTSEQVCKVLLTICVCKIKMDSKEDILPLLLLAEQYAVKTQSKTLLIRCLNLQANHLMRTGYLQESVQKLLFLLEIVESEESRISNYNNLGLVYITLGMYDKSFECLFENLKICEASKNYRGYIRSCVNIGIAYCELKNYEKSVEYYKAAQKYSADYPDDESIMFLTVNLGLTYAHLSEFDKALDLINEALNMEKSLEYVKNKGSLIYNLGYVYELKGELNTAMQYYEQALVIIRTTPNIILLVAILNSKAGIHIQRKEFTKAEELLIETLRLTSESSLPPQKGECLRKLAMLHQEMGNHQEAYAYLNQYLNLNESIFNEKVKNGIIKYESDYLTGQLAQKAEIFRLQNVELVEKNKIISQKQQELEEVLFRLSDANATKDKLFSIIAHDLRGPVSSLQMALQVILSNKVPQQEQEKLLILLNEQTKNTYNLLENLLWWANSQKEGLKLKLVSLAINPIIEDICSVYKSIAQNKKVLLDIRLDPGLKAYADKDAVDLILRNLVNNAIKYSFAESSVMITGSMKDGKLIIVVSDHGCGINPKIIKALERKQEIQSIPGTDNEKGMGLGLSLCYEFTAKMNGKISIDKNHKQGTCFILSLPASRTGIKHK